MTPTVAIVGRPNVGKSTLFNRIVGGRSAIVHDRPGVTRDRHYDTTTKWGDREIVFVDTGGFEPDPSDDLFRAIREQALAAVEEAHAVLFVVDARAGVTPMDAETARLLRGSERPIFLVANKVEGYSQEITAMEFHAFGLGEIYMLSAEHGHGVGALMDDLLEVLPMEEEAPEAPADALIEDIDGEAADSERPEEIRIAIVGRPNIGKSTLVNRLIGEDRHVVHDAPGTTMDAIDSELIADGKRYLLVDTAGVRRKSRVSDELEGFAVSRAVRAIERCHITLLMIDGSLGPTEQDARLANLIDRRGRALIILVNKWDKVREDPERDIQVIRDEFERRMAHVDWAPVLYISALTGKGVHRILETVEEIYPEFDKRISTADCNRFLQIAVHNHSVPQRYHRPVRLNYMTQIRVRPPTFVIWSNTPDGVEAPYQRYLKNRLREAYGFRGSPIRLELRKKRRPWDEDGEEEG